MLLREVLKLSKIEYFDTMRPYLVSCVWFLANFLPMPPLRSGTNVWTRTIPLPYKESLMIVWSFLYYLFMRKK